MDNFSEGDAEVQSVHGKGPAKDKNGRYTCDDVRCTESFKRKCDWR
jgi:hypothetical protein